MRLELINKTKYKTFIFLLNKTITQQTKNANINIKKLCKNCTSKILSLMPISLFSKSLCIDKKINES